MDDLLCDESWLSSPLTPEPSQNFRCNVHDDDVVMSPAMDAAAVDEAMSVDLEKETRFSIHGDKFLEFLVSKKLTDARFHAVQWLIQTRNRLNLTFETVFSAANCFDRFVYVTSCNEWSNWMVELVIVTSLSIASKFNEVTSPSLQELQMEGLNHVFHHNTVLEMELIVLRALDWRVNAVTSYSFLQILVSKLYLVGDNVTTNVITDHLLDYLCDFKMVEYPPSVIAVSATLNVLEMKGLFDENGVTPMKILGQDRKEAIEKCVNAMKSRNVEKERRSCYEVKSLVSVLHREVNYQVGNLSAIFKILRSEGSDKKRERDNYEDKIRPAKRMTFVMSI